MIRFFIIFILLTLEAKAETLQIIATQPHPVVGEMVLLTLRGEYTRQILLEKLKFPDSDGYDWIQLSRDEWHTEAGGGGSAKVFERRLAVFPRHPGTLSIGPVTHRLTVDNGTGGREELDVDAAAVALDVEPFPASGLTTSAGYFVIEDNLSTPPNELRLGETLIRRVTLKARGTLPHLLPPRPKIQEPWLISFAAPEERETETTVEGPETTVIWVWKLRPKTGEPGVLPPIEIPWFDTAGRRMRVAQIPAIPFGYKGFSENSKGIDRLPVSQTAMAILACGTGVLSGLILTLGGLSSQRKGNFSRILRRLSPIDPTKRIVKRAAASGDLFAFRRAIEIYLQRRRELGLPISSKETVELDKALFSRNGSLPGSDPRKIIESLFHHK